MEKGGTLEYLTTDLKTTLFTLHFFNLGVFKVSPDKVEAAVGETARKGGQMRPATRFGASRSRCTAKTSSSTTTPPSPSESANHPPFFACSRSRFFSAAQTGLGTIEDTSPPNCATSLTSEELT